MLRWSSRMLVGGGAILLLLNTAYIAAFASPTVFYAANAFLHVGLGLIVWIGALAIAWRDRGFRDQTMVRTAIVLLTAAGALALELIRRGNLAEMRWALVAHVVAGGLAVAAFVPVARRLAIAAASRGTRGFGLTYLAAAGVLAVFPVGASLWAAARSDPADRIVNRSPTPMSMDQEGAGPNSPFFPSAAQTNTGTVIPADFFLDSEQCGECHADIYEQWKGSAHHF